MQKVLLKISTLLLTLAFFFTGATPAFAAFTFVQTATAVQTSSNSQAVTVSATAQNDLVVVHVDILSSNETLSSVTDDKGNTYVVQAVTHGGPSSPSEVNVFQAYGIQTTAGATTITANYSGSTNFKRIGVDEYAGFNAGATNATVFDTTSASNSASASLTTISVPSFNPSSTGNLIVATAGTDGTTVWTAGSNYTLSTNVLVNVVQGQYRLSSGSSETAPISWVSAMSGAERATSFKLNAPAAPASFGTLLMFGEW